MTQLIRLLADDSGAALAEYALISAVLAMVMIAGLAAIVTECGSRLTVTSSKMTLLGTAPS